MNMDMKLCTKCNQLKDRSLFSKQSSRMDGLRSHCKSCISEKQKSAEGKSATRAYRENNIEKIRKIKRDYRLNNKDKVREAEKLWRDSNKDKVAAIAKESRLRNRPARLEGQRIYNLENADRKREYMRIRYITNNDEIRARNKQASRKWRQNNKYIIAAKTAKYLADKKRATPKWANKEAIEAIYKQAERIRAETGVDWHVDHIVPLNSDIVCGLHCEANLQILYYKENIIKGNRYWPDMPQQIASTSQYGAISA